MNNQKEPVPTIQCFDSENNEILCIEQNGDVIWKGRKVETDEEFKSAMIDLANVLKSNILPNNPTGVTIAPMIYKFLMGEGSIDGCWFGDRHSTLRGAFWWRSMLCHSAEAYTHSAQPVQPVEPVDLRQAALIDLAYINGAKAGWNMCVAGDDSQFKKLTEGVVECVNVLKNTRTQATVQPVQQASKSRLCSCIECVPDEPPADVVRELMDWLRFAYQAVPRHSTLGLGIEATLAKAKEHGL